MIHVELDLVALAVACFAVSFGLVELAVVVRLHHIVRALEADVATLKADADYRQVRLLLASYEARARGFEQLYLDLLQREDAAGSNGSGRHYGA